MAGSELTDEQIQNNILGVVRLCQPCGAQQLTDLFPEQRDAAARAIRIMVTRGILSFEDGFKLHQTEDCDARPHLRSEGGE